MGFCSYCGNWVDEGDICSHCGGSGDSCGSSGYDEEEDDENEFDPFLSRYEYFIRQGKTCSIKGDHETAIKFYEEAMNYLGSNSVLPYIADEYVAMGDYSAGLRCWNEYCPEGDNDISHLYNKGKFLKRIGRYDDAIKIHKKQLNKVENKIDLQKESFPYNDINWYFDFINEIIDSYESWGKYDLADNYWKIKKEKIDVIVNNLLERAEMELEKEDSNFFIVKGFYRDALNIDPNNDNLKRKIVNNYIKYAGRAMKNGQFAHARQYYKFASELNPNNIDLKRKLEESNRIYQEDRQSNGKLRKEAKRKKEREERQKKYEQQRIANEKWKKEFEERERKRKEECEKNPECIKKEIQHFKKKVLKDYYLLLYFDHYQNKSDIKFKEILEYEDLLEKLGVKENYSREDLKILKKENKRIKYIISHVDDKYRGNGVKLFVKNQKKIDELEKRYPEKGFIKSVINEVFDNSEYIAALEIESSAREKIHIAETKSLSNNNVDFYEAMDLLNQASTELSNYLKNKNPNQYPNLMNLNNDITKLEGKIYSKIDKLINLRKLRLFLIKRDKYQNNQFECKPGIDLKLVKEDDEDTIAVYHKDEPIGIVSKTFDSDFEKQFSNISQLQYIQKSSEAKYFFKYGRFDIIEIEENTLKKAKAKLKSKQQLINKYPKEDLITLGPGIDKNIELKQGMKFKLIKESDSDSIKVYSGNDELGFVANNLVCNLTSKANDIKIPDDCYAEYLCKYDNYHLARIINKLRPAKDYISKEEYDKAIKSLDELLAEEPDNIEYWSIKCSCHNKLEQYEEVNNCYDKLIKLDPNNFEYWENKASNLINMKRLDDAIDCLDNAISLDLYNPTFYSLKGNALELKEKEELRIKQEKILKEYPKHELITITEISSHHPDFKEAMVFKLIKEPYDNFIAVYLKDDKIGYVANSNDAVCDLTSDASDIKYIPDICYARYIMKYCDEYHIAQLITSTRYIKVKLALEYTHKKEYSKALDCYNEVLELYPDDEYCLNRKGQVLLSLERWHEALKFYDEIDSWGGKAEVYIQMGRYEDALECYDKIDSWSGKAEVLIKLERYEEALYCCDKIFELRQTAYVKTLRDLARLFIDAGNYSEAIKCLDNALSQHPNEPSVLSLKEYALSCLMEEN